MTTDPIRMCELLVGLPDVTVRAVTDPSPATQMVVEVETTLTVPVGCGECGTRARIKDRAPVGLVDLPAFGRATRLRWVKRRWCCLEPSCATGSWTELEPRIGAARMAMTARAGRWATYQVGKLGRTVSEVADELGCDWHTVNDTVVAYGVVLVDDPDRIGGVTALGLDETLFVKRGKWRAKQWSTSIVDVGAGQLLDVVEGRDSAPACDWLDNRPPGWCGQIRYGTLDLSGPYRKVFNTKLAHVTQVADPYHVVQLSGKKLNETRQRVQQETTGHRGRAGEPLYRARKLLDIAHERLDEDRSTKLTGLLAAGDPHGEITTAWHAKEAVRELYGHRDPQLALEWVDQLSADMRDESCPPEVQQLGRTMHTWRSQIAAWHEAQVSNGPTESCNNLAKRIKRVAFGMTNFANWRIRVLLYAGKPDWSLLSHVQPV